MKNNIDNIIRSQQLCNVIILLGALFFQSLNAKDVNLQALEPGKRENNIYHVWIYFNDKNIKNIQNENSYLLQLRKSMEPRTIKRRKKVKSINNLVDTYDIPVSMSYIKSVIESGVKIRTISKWMNAVSASGIISQIEIITHYPFVKKIEPVLIGKRPKINVNPPLYNIQSDSSFYGDS